MSVEQIKVALNELGFWDLMKIAMYDDWLLFVNYWYVWVGIVAIGAIVAYLVANYKWPI